MDNTQKTLTRDEAYDAIVDYLDPYYFQVLANDPTSSGDLGSLLGCMMLASDETPMDSAVTSYWNRSIDKILNKRLQKLHLEKKETINLTSEEAYAAMIDYLDDYRNRLESEEVGTLLNLMSDKKSASPIAWNDWMQTVDKMSDPKTRIRQYFKLLPSEIAAERQSAYTKVYAEQVAAGKSEDYANDYGFAYTAQNSNDKSHDYANVFSTAYSEQKMTGKSHAYAWEYARQISDGKSPTDAYTYAQASGIKPSN